MKMKTTMKTKAVKILGTISVRFSLSFVVISLKFFFWVIDVCNLNIVNTDAISGGADDIGKVLYCFVGYLFIFFLL